MNNLQERKDISITKTSYELIDEMEKKMEKVKDMFGELESIVELDSSLSKGTKKTVEELGVDIENAAFGCFSLQNKLG